MLATRIFPRSSSRKASFGDTLGIPSSETVASQHRTLASTYWENSTVIIICKGGVLPQVDEIINVIKFAEAVRA